MGLPIGHLSMSGVHSCASETHKYASILFQPVCDRWIDILRIFTCACRCRLEISKLLAEYRHSHEHNFNFQRYRYPSFVIVVSMTFIVHHTILFKWWKMITFSINITYLCTLLSFVFSSISWSISCITRLYHCEVAQLVRTCKYALKLHVTIS